MKAEIPGCRGFVLWPGRRLRLELWICREDVERHRHPGQRVEVMPIWGQALFYRQDVPRSIAQDLEIGPKRWFHWLSIPAGWWHGFVLRNGPLVFVNATFDGRSPAENFQR